MVQMLKVFCIQDHTKVFRSYGGKCLKRILKYLCCTKYNKINICNLNAHKHVSYKNGINNIFILCTG